MTDDDRDFERVREDERDREGVVDIKNDRVAVDRDVVVGEEKLLAVLEIDDDEKEKGVAVFDTLPELDNVSSDVCEDALLVVDAADNVNALD